ncbi:RnfABCDGE type electron transport complex subunit D [Treponema sp.]|uniref:RnfABCDGE type electron transport complex subunit D n=1 Tax=Treponema sp. TaxID=166 RepID=UPI003FA2AFD0
MPYNRTQRFPAPYIYSGISTQSRVRLVIALLALYIAVMGMAHDFSGIMLIICTGTAAVSASLLIGYQQGTVSFDIHALLAGLLMGFFIPADGGLVFSFFIAFMSYFLSWGIFGGKGSSWVNPVMLTVCIAAICKPACFVHPVDAEQIISGGSVYAALESAGVSRIPADQYLTSLFNSTVLHNIGVTLPEGYLSLLFVYPSSIPAFRYNLLTLFCSIILLSSKALHKTLPFAFLAVYGMLIYFFPSAHKAAPLGRGDILSALLTSGALFSAFFVMNDSGSIPRSWGGRLISGILTGIFAFFMSGTARNPAGIPFAVLFTDCINPLIEQGERVFYQKRRRAL